MNEELAAKFESWRGLKGPTFHFPIELGKVREFANSLFAASPAYLQGHHPVIPPTFPVVAGYLWGYILESASANELSVVEIDERMSLDAEQEYIYYGVPPRAGDVLTAQTGVEKVWQKAGRRGGTLTFYRTRSDYHDEAGRLVGANVSTSVVPAGVPDTPSVPTGDYMQLPYSGEDDRRDQLNSIEQADWSELVEGGGPGTIAMPPLTLTDVVTYQIVSGSRGAAHHDVIAARAEGWPNYFSIAMLHAGLLGVYSTNWLGAENVRRFKLRFLDMIWPGDVLYYSGEVTRLYEEQGARKVDIKLDCSRADGESTMNGSATFELP